MIEVLFSYLKLKRLILIMDNHRIFRKPIHGYEELINNNKRE